MRHFRLPLIITAIALLVAIAVGIIGVTSIHGDSKAHKNERAQQLGGTVAIASMFVITPFWLIAAGKVGKARREARERNRRS